MTFIEGYDPGKSTGYVRGVFDDDLHYTPIVFDTLSPEQVYRKVLDWEQEPDCIRVVENFRLRGSNQFTAKLRGVGLIEVMKFRDYMLPSLRPIVWQKPTDKALVPDQLLKDTGLWRTGGQVGSNTGRHVNDATIHVLAYLFKQKHQPTIKWYWPQ